jgi:hypothetical protein
MLLSSTLLSDAGRQNFNIIMGITVEAFQLSRVPSVSNSASRRSVGFFVKSNRKNKSNNSNDDESGPGMNDAFRQLEKLQSLDDDSLLSALLSSDDNKDDGDDDDDSKSREQLKKKRKDEAFAQAMKELNLKDMLESPVPSTPESEVELYKDMASELSAASSEEDMIADLKSDLILEEELISSSLDAKNEEFMNQAIQEALQEAKEQNPDVSVNKESLLDNKEIMSEIEKIFDKANDKLLEGLEEIRAEQVGVRHILGIYR